MAVPALRVLVAVCLLMPAAARAERLHGYSFTGTPKYPAGFARLDHADPDTPRGGELVLAFTGGFDSLNPFIPAGTAAPGIMGLVYQSLFAPAPDEAASYYGVLAESVEVADDLSHVTFYLRENARFGDGRPVRARDAVFSLNILKEKGSPYYSHYYAGIERAEEIDPLTVRFHFRTRDNRELPWITGQLPVLPAHWWEGRDFTAVSLEPPPGSGPCEVAGTRPGQSVTFSCPDDWWGRKLPLFAGRYNARRITWLSFRDVTVAFEAFKAGLYDFRHETYSRLWAESYDFPAFLDGRVKRQEVAHRRPAGMQAFVFNTRRAPFAAIEGRRAISLLFDFEWSNRALFHGQYRRLASFFTNTPLAAREPPSAAEQALVQAIPGLPPAVLAGEVYQAPRTDGSGRDRNNLRLAGRILDQAGYRLAGGQRLLPDGQPFTFGILLVQAEFQRIVDPFLRNLKRLGITGTVRIVDAAQYQRRLQEFDFDMVVASYPAVAAPGNEQYNYWHSTSADQAGSLNLAGARDPALDTLIDRLVQAPPGEKLVAAARALDRTLLFSHYVIPQYYSPLDRIAWWDHIRPPGEHPPYGVDLYSWQIGDR